MSRAPEPGVRVWQSLCLEWQGWLWRAVAEGGDSLALFLSLESPQTSALLIGSRELQTEREVTWGSGAVPERVGHTWGCYQLVPS